MEVGGVNVPGAKAFQFGVGIVAGLAIVGAVLSAVVQLGSGLPVIGALVGILGGLLSFVVGWGATIIGGVGGGYYAASNGGVSETADGAMIGGLVGAVGGVIGGLVGALLQFGVTFIQAGGFSAILGLIFGLIGAVIGGLVITGIFGVIGGVIAVEM